MDNNIPDSVQHMIEFNQKIYYKLSILGTFMNGAFSSEDEAKSIISAWKKEADSCGYNDLFNYKCNTDITDKYKVNASCSDMLITDSRLDIVLPFFALLRNQSTFFKLNIQSKELTVYLYNLNWTELNALFNQCRLDTLRIITDTTKVVNFNSLIRSCIIKELDLTSFSTKTTVDLNKMFSGYTRIGTLRISTDFEYTYSTLNQNLFERIVTRNNR